MSTSGPQIKTTNPNVVVSSSSITKGSIIAKNDGAIEKDAEQPTLASIPLQELGSSSRTSTADEIEHDPSPTQKSVDRKGKGRARPVESSVDELENYDLGEHKLESDDETQEYPYVNPMENTSDVYPPVGDDELEERRVTENLKRWEEAERQRRKAARDSSRPSFNSSRSSLVGDVGRRASKLWKDGAQRRSSLRRGATRLRDDVSFEETPANGRMSSSNSHDHSSGANGNVIYPTPSRTTTLSLQDGRTSSPSSPTPLVSNNPFSTPRGGSPVSQLEENSSLSNGPKGPETALMQESSNPPTPAVDSSITRDPEFGDRPVLQASTSYNIETSSPTNPQAGRRMSKPPPPQPLDLPKTVSPPPRQLKRTPSPVLLVRTQADIEDDDELEARETNQGRWWTDWLCGCRESGRQGQDQSGRTNPFE